MKNVTRPPKPASLAANASHWTDELLAWMESHPTAQFPAALVKRYAQPDVREALRTMYRNQCCYCEGRITDVSYDHIEHRRPKSKFPDRTFDWENLHLACPKCNIKKSDLWSDPAPILDAVVDRPLTDHLTYRVGETGVFCWPKSQRGTTTVQHAGLNRDGSDGLPGRRARVLLEALRVIWELRERLDAPGAMVVQEELEEKKKLEYGSVIAFALEREFPTGA